MDMAKIVKVILERKPALTFCLNQRAETRTTSQASLTLLATPSSLSPSLQGKAEATLLLDVTHILYRGVAGLPRSRFRNSWEGEEEEEKEGKVRA